MTADPFAQYRLSAKTQVQQPTEQPQEEAQIQQDNQEQQDPFSEYRVEKEEGKPWYQELGRHATRTASRVAETIGGIPGDIEHLINSGLLTALEKISGKRLSEEYIQELEKDMKAPTSSELKKLSEEYSEGYTKAQGPVEKSVDEFTEFASGLLGPMKFRKALGVAAGSQLAKEGIKVAGGSEGSQEAGKLGTMFALTVFNPGSAMKFAASQYERANQLSKGVSISTKTMETNLNKLIQDVSYGIPTPGKNVVIKTAEDVLAKVTNGKTLVKDLTSAKRDLNSIMKDPSVLSREKKLLKHIASQVDQAIRPYEKINPAFGKAYRPANEIFGAVMQGTKASDFLRKSLGPKSVLGAALGEVALGHPEFVMPTLAAAGVATAAAKTGDFFVRLAKSPELQKFYSKALIAAAKEDAAALRLYSDKIDDIYKKEAPPYKIKDVK